MHDFQNLLKKWTKILSENSSSFSFLEWGPGFSTSLVHEIKPEAKIISIEHDKKYFEIAQKNYGHFAKLFHKSIKKNTDYATFPLKFNEKFDIVFVDGRRRIECCFVAFEIVKNNGVIILHDAQRQNYSLIEKYVEIVDQDKHTKVFKEKKR